MHSAVVKLSLVQMSMSYHGTLEWWMGQAGLNPSPVLACGNHVASWKGRLEQESGLWKCVNAAQDQSSLYLKPNKQVGGHEEQVTNVFGMSNKDIEEMPWLVWHVKCQVSFESSNPGCNSNKFTHVQGKCGEAMQRQDAMASWRPIVSSFIHVFWIFILLLFQNEWLSQIPHRAPGKCGSSRLRAYPEDKRDFKRLWA